MDLTTAQELANQKITKHGLAASGWRFEWDNAQRRRGCCDYARRKITLSRPITELLEDQHVLDTVLHEVAHALVGPGCGHGTTWRKAAKSIGCTANRCASDPVQLKRPFIGTCPGCGRTIERFKRKKISCGKCGAGQYNDAYAFQWKRV